MRFSRFVTFLFTCVLFSLLSGKVYCISESGFKQRYAQVVYPFVTEKLENRFFKNSDGHRVSWFYLSQTETNLSNTVFVLQGRTESYRKYIEVIYDLYHLGYNVITLDWVGQGSSEHISSKDNQYGHISNFKTYVDDLKKLVDERKVKEIVGENKKFVMAHSMGGNIASQFMVEHPSYFDKGMLLAPMLKIKTDPFPEKVGYYLLKFLEFIGLSESSAPFSSKFDRNEKNTVASSSVRREVFTEQRAKFEDDIIGPPTNGYARAAIEATWKAQEVAHLVETPLLLFQAMQDSIVDPVAQKSFCDKAKNCTLHTYGSARHEFFLEVDKVRNEVFEHAEAFFK